MIGSLPRPVIFAHRGASALAPENTLAAFKLARDQGANAIELDVQLTADKSIIVFHDTTVDRTTNSTGKIRHLSVSDLQNLKAGYVYGPAFENVRIPTLDEVFTEFSDFPLINIELKNSDSPTDNLPILVAERIQNHRMEDHVLVSSFNPIALRRFHKLLPDIPLGRLMHFPRTVEYFRLFPSQLKIYRTVHTSFAALNSSRINYFHSLGKLVFTYTLNHPSDMIKALNLGVDGFFTDDPGLANKITSKIKFDDRNYIDF